MTRLDKATPKAEVHRSPLGFRYVMVFKGDAHVGAVSCPRRHASNRSIINIWGPMMDDATILVGGGA